MPSVKIYYFSATENTKRVAETYVNEFANSGVNATSERITGTTFPDNFDCDLICIAYPVHGFNAPSVVEDFAKCFPVSKGERVFFIKTSGEPLKLNDASSVRLIKILKRKDYEITQEHYYCMPYNMIFRHSDEMASKMFATAKSRVPQRVQSLLKGEKRLPKSYPFSAKAMSAICRIERKWFKFNGKHYKIDPNKCINCGLCVKNCPMGNITKTAEGFKFGGNCIGCAACAFNCPKDAISAGFLNFMKVNGKYDFGRDGDKAVIGRYCRKAYRGYFNGKSERDAF